MELSKYSAEPVECTISGKQADGPAKPCHSYIQIDFDKPDSGFSFIIFQNFYTARITVKSLKPGCSPDDETAWERVYSMSLMKNAHYEGDAMDWHLVTAQQFNTKFDRSNCRAL